jgi:hypothetical protein
MSMPVWLEISLDLLGFASFIALAKWRSPRRRNARANELNGSTMLKM